MKKLEYALRKCRKFYQTYEKQVKIAVIAIVVITALLLFGGNGETEEITVGQGVENQTEITVDETNATAETSSTNIVVDISGCVNIPGVYEIPDGTRLHQVIAEAGGLTEDADIDAINQAEQVTDGQKIRIPAKGSTGSVTEHTNENQDGTGRININHADSSTLQQISGVGPATAEKIIQYRESNGSFQTIEDLKNVSGIGEKTFEKMKDQICV